MVLPGNRYPDWQGDLFGALVMALSRFDLKAEGWSEELFEQLVKPASAMCGKALTRLSLYSSPTKARPDGRVLAW